MSAQDKLQNFTEMFGTGRTIGVLLDPRSDEVDIPENLKQLPTVKLHFGLSLPVPIEKLSVSSEGISAVLSFSRMPQPCYLPWNSVFALIFEDNQSGKMWPENVPPEVQVRGPEMGPPPDAEAKKLISGNAEQGVVAPEDKKKMFGVLDGGSDGSPQKNETGTAVDMPSLRLVTNEEDAKDDDGDDEAGDGEKGDD